MEEQQQAATATTHTYSDENIVAVELLNIEEALRFDRLETTTLKQVPIVG